VGRLGIRFCSAMHLKEMRERERERERETGREQLLMLIRFLCTVLYLTAEERAIPHDAHGKTLEFGRSTVGSKEA
jgi:hypothetical protein